jgi:protoporphyrinogen/coproporphyrinogen III oxidase
MTDVIVIGGGVAGLVAARECAQVGLSVTLLEATDAVGGAVASQVVAGLTLDSGAESFAVRRGAVADYLAGLGLSEEIVSPNPAGAWLRLPALRPGGEPISVPLPKTGVLGIPGSPLADDVRAAIGWGGAWRAWLDRLLPVLTIGREHSLGELVRKRMGVRVLERLVEPVASGVYSAPAVDLEVDVVAPGLNAALTTTGSLSGAVLALRGAAPAGAAGSAVGGLRGGMSRLVSALATDLERLGVDVVCGAPATRLIRTGTEEDPAWVVTATRVGPPPPEAPLVEAPPPEPPLVEPPLVEAVPVEPSPAEPVATTETFDARFVILATPGAQALALLGPLSAETTALAALDWPEPTAVELATIVITAAGLDAHPRGTGILVAADVPDVTAKALTHVSAKWPWVAAAAGDGTHVLRLSYGRAGQGVPSAGLSDAQFEALALRDASTLLGAELPSHAVRGFARTTWRNALSPATVGARERVAAVTAVLDTVPGLDATGAWLAGTGLASVIPHAQAAGTKTRRAALGI